MLIEVFFPSYPVDVQAFADAMDNDGMSVYVGDEVESAALHARGQTVPTSRGVRVWVEVDYAIELTSIARTFDVMVVDEAQDGRGMCLWVGKKGSRFGATCAQNPTEASSADGLWQLSSYD